MMEWEREWGGSFSLDVFYLEILGLGQGRYLVFLFHSVWEGGVARCCCIRAVCDGEGFGKRDPCVHA